MLRTLTCQLLLFPTLVVLLASASFFCGMTCSAWQWYVAIAATLAAPFVMREGRSAARLSGAAFLATPQKNRFRLAPPSGFYYTFVRDAFLSVFAVMRLFQVGWLEPQTPRKRSL